MLRQGMRPGLPFSGASGEFMALGMGNTFIGYGETKAAGISRSRVWLTTFQNLSSMTRALR